MPVEVVVPALGESVVEATVGRWIKKEGDRVSAGEALVELETDKVNLEVSASQPGILEHIERHEGDTVQIGDVLATLADGAEGPAVSPLPAQAAQSAAVEAAPAPAPSETPEAVRATPVARKVAQEQGVDLAKVEATGPGRRATKDDVLRAAGQKIAAPAPTGGNGSGRAVPPPATTPPPAAGPQTEGREERQRMSRRRLTIAQRLVEAQQTAAMLTTFNEIDMTAVMEIRRRRKDDFRERHGIGLGFMSFFTRAVIGALKAYPQLNAEIQGDEIVLKRYYNIGIAVGAEEGLVVPVVRDVDRMSFAEIEQAIADVARRAREGALSIEDLRGGTFSITNGGIYGSLLSTPILNPPQVGILGMHRIQERPVAHEGQVVIRPMMYVALTYDHRIVDGSEAVQFLVRVKELVEDPERLLLEG